ncbi:MAG: hypothetical protein U5K54_25120 [Cytophagales bacterium]|nr:hypothetical protein [Cytophagales bacterium]
MKKGILFSLLTLWIMISAVYPGKLHTLGSKRQRELPEPSYLLGTLKFIGEEEISS